MNVALLKKSCRSTKNEINVTGDVAVFEILPPAIDQE